MLKQVEEGIRIDAELYQKKFVIFFKKLQELSTTSFENEADTVKKGIFDIKSDCYSNNGIPFVRISNLKNMIIEDNDIVYIPTKENDKNLDTFLEQGDIILSKTAYPAASLVNLDWCNTSQDTVAIKLKSTSKLLSHFVVTYLNTTYGLGLMKRWFTGNVQMHLNLEDCKRNLLIPLFSLKFQKEIKHLFEKSIWVKTQSKDLYAQSETLLLNVLGLADFSPGTEKINIKSFKDSFVATGRLDAEYYQPKYGEMMVHIAAQPHEKLAALVTIQKSMEPGSDAYTDDENGLPFLRVADYNKFGITAPQKKLKAAFVTENMMKLAALKPKTGTILFSKDGSVGEAYCLHEDADFITSGAVLHLTVRDTEQILPDYLTLALNSKLIRMQAERDAGGSIILHWRISEIENVIVPIVDMTTQTQIAALVQQSFALKAKSERLLEMAKRAVEIAIETDEQTAMAYINDQTGVQT